MSETELGSVDDRLKTPNRGGVNHKKREQSRR